MKRKYEKQIKKIIQGMNCPKHLTYYKLNINKLWQTIEHQRIFILIFLRTLFRHQHHAILLPKPLGVTYSHSTKEVIKVIFTFQHIPNLLLFFSNPTTHKQQLHNCKIIVDKFVPVWYTYIKLENFEDTQKCLQKQIKNN